MYNRCAVDGLFKKYKPAQYYVYATARNYSSYSMNYNSLATGCFIWRSFYLKSVIYGIPLHNFRHKEPSHP